MSRPKLKPSGVRSRAAAVRFRDSGYRQGRRPGAYSHSRLGCWLSEEPFCPFRQIGAVISRSRGLSYVERGERPRRSQSFSKGNGIVSPPQGSAKAARRDRTAERDRAIIQAVQAGESMRAAGHQYGLSDFAVRHILKRGAG